MRVSELEGNLHAAQIRWDDTIKKNAPLEERLAARKAVLQAERVLSLAQGKETALACEWEVPWEIGAPLPHVVSSGMRTYLMYVANEPDPDWDGSFVTEMRTMDQHHIALVEFTGCYTFQFGGPNDEVIGGHQLWGRGLELYSAHEIVNSRWLAEMESINSIHPHYHADWWKTLKHYLLLFHDETFECLARGYTIEILWESLEHVLEIARARLYV